MVLRGKARLFTSQLFFRKIVRIERLPVQEAILVSYVPRGWALAPPKKICHSLHTRWPTVTQSAQSYGKIGDCEHFRVKLAHTLVSFFTSFLHQIRHL